MYSNEVRKKIFIEEIEALKEKKYIDEDLKDEVLNKYNHYYEELTTIDKSTMEEERDLARPLEMTQNDKVEKEHGDTEKTVLNGVHLKQEKNKQEGREKQPKVALSSEKIRERNITWMLILGTLLLLLGGVVLATNSWDQMTPLLKTISIGLIAGLFYVLSIFSYKILKISKTAFAFLTLGSLFIPITILSAGYFELFGHWFSLHGDGNYLFLAIGFGLTIPVYVKHALSQHSRLYVWISYVVLSLAVFFLIASFHLERDLMYIGILLFNVLLLSVHYKWINKDNTFTKELPKYVQGNLALSTLLLVFIFNNNEVIFSVNLILTGLVYLYVLFASKRKENHFVFTILFIYGAYLFIENTALKTVDLALFAAIGFVFIALSKNENDEGTEKLMRYTSAIVSLCSFIFVTGKAVFMYDEHTPLLLALSYLLISLIYGYLANIMKKIIFTYTTIFFLLLAGTQLVSHIDNLFSYELKPVGYFILGLLIYLVLYLYNQWKYTVSFKQPAFLFSLLSMIVSIGAMFYFEQWFTSIVALLIFAFVSYQLTYLEEKHATTFNYISVGSLLLAGIMFYPIITMENTAYENHLTIIGHSAFVSVLGVGISHIFKTFNKVALSKALDWSGLLLYGLTILFVFDYPMNAEYMLPIYLLIGAYLTARMGHQANISAFWYVSGIWFSFTYIAFLHNTLQLGLQQDLLAFALGPIMLLIISRIYKQQYFIIAQFYTFILLAITSVFFFDNTIVLLLIGLIFVSSFMQIKFIQLKVIYLFISFTMLPIVSFSLFGRFDLYNNYVSHFLIILSLSSIVYFTFRYVFKDEFWRKKTSAYNVAFSNVAVSFLSTAYTTFLFSDTSLFTLIILLSYIAFTVYITTISKVHLLAILPLLLSVNVVQALMELLNLSLSNGIFAYILFFFIVKLIGEKRYDELFNSKTKSVDVFAVTALTYLGWLFVIPIFNEVHVVFEVLPSILIVYFFYSQINRIDGLQRIVKTMTYASVLIPYYKILEFIEIHELIEVEVYVLPFLVLLIFLSKQMWNDKEKIMNVLQWVGLIITSGVIVQDALVSNTIYDAFLIGILSLTAIFYGFNHKMKSYFIVGSVVLLLTVLIQTKPFWGNMPWWIYLIGAGSILIGAGSYHEWKKQKGKSNKEPKWKSLWREWK